MSQQQPQQQQVQVKASDEMLAGKYANVMQVLHTKEEFVLDFLNVFPPSGSLNARVIVSPAHVKRMVSALAENLKKYEEQFGTIAEGDVPETKIGF